MFIKRKKIDLITPGIMPKLEAMSVAHVLSDAALTSFSGKYGSHGLGSVQLLQALDVAFLKLSENISEDVRERLYLAIKEKQNDDFSDFFSRVAPERLSSSRLEMRDECVQIILRKFVESPNKTFELHKFVVFLTEELEDRLNIPRNELFLHSIYINSLIEVFSKTRNRYHTDTDWLFVFRLTLEIAFMVCFISVPLEPRS